MVTSFVDGGLKWVNFVIITVEKQGQWLCFGCVRRITLNVTCSNVTCYVLCSRNTAATITAVVVATAATTNNAVATNTTTFATARTASSNTTDYCKSLIFSVPYI